MTRGALAPLLATFVLGLAAGAAAAQQPSSGSAPLLAYYYIWFTPSHAPGTEPTTGTVSWNRPKTDYPLLGRYSSDERPVMRRHVRWARRSGIDGFIVSWKSTRILNRRLEDLIRVAEAQDFDLLVIYQGLDARRRPLPAQRVADDLDLFAERYADSPAFGEFDAPAVVWSGTWEFSRDEIAAVTEDVGERLLVLASERHPRDYERIADLVDGDAYYWSSVNPDTFPGYEEKLRAMAESVHAGGGLWIAPAAPGFDGRLVGGSTVVDRRGGATLRRQLAAAGRSSPDAIGLISWNEFSEGSHVEPSERYGKRFLEVLADARGLPPPAIELPGESEPAATQLRHALPLLGGLLVLVLGGLAALGRRRRAGAPTSHNGYRRERST